VRTLFLLTLACHRAPDPGAADTGAPPAPVAGIEVTAHADLSTILRVSWTQDEPVDEAWIEFGVPGEEPRTTPAIAGAEGACERTLLGLPGESPVEFRVVNLEGGERLESATVQAETGAIPTALPRPHLVHADPAAQSPERFMIGSIGLSDRDWYQGPWWLYAVDRFGRVVWYREIPDGRCTMHATVARDGTHLLYEETTIYTGDHGAGSLLHRLGLDLVRDEVIDASGLGSTFAETDSGVLFDSYADWPTIALDEQFPDGTRQRIWDCSAWMDAGNPFACDPNETVWVEDRDAVLWSMWASDTIVELDRRGGDVVRQLGAMDGSWAFDPPEAAFQMQHYPHYTADGTLLVSTHVPGQAGEQRAREYRVDEATETLVEVWSYGEEVPHYAFYAGEAYRFANGNTFVSYGSDGSVREIDAEARTVWQLDWDSTYLLGHASFVEDLYALVR
jgi:hypothetical protein